MRILIEILPELLLLIALAFAVARFAQPPWRGRLMNVLKVWLTFRMCQELLTIPVSVGDGQSVPAWELVLEQLRQIDATTFVVFALLGTAIRMLGVMASMVRWQLVLLGQGIELPFRHIFGSFLIGRAIGFFLPSTAGLDAYTLYDAARFSGRTVEVTAGKVLEKVVGFSGIFLSYLVALPFGISIFGERAGLVAAITVPLAAGVIAALLVVLWFPGLFQWLLRVIPIPAKERLEGVVTRISNASAAYRDKKLLVLAIFGLSFAVHFTTAAMYFFTAIAIGAGADAAFWPIVFGSSIQIFATVLGPTIGGIGVREAAQALVLGAMIGPVAAGISATLGFWIGEVPTLLGFWFWIVRKEGYTPSHCRVNGDQVDYAEAAKAAVALETHEERERREARAGELPSLASRAVTSAGFGLGAGIWAGLAIGLVETFVIWQGGLGTEGQVFWYGPLAYALLLGALGLGGGLALAVLPMDRDEIRGWTPSLAMLGFVPIALAIALFRIRRDVYLEQMPPVPVLLALVGAALAVMLVFFFAGRAIFRSPLGGAMRPLPAVAGLAAVVLAGFVASRVAVEGGAELATPPAVPARLADAPNLILVMVDTLRADHLSCYGSDEVRTPNMCQLASDGGTVFDAFGHASWTKPTTATLLTSLFPSTHNAVSKQARLPEDATLVSEVLQDHGYTTGGIVSNINLAESFGFAQGFDEYTYLAPDYIGGATESSSKLILYQIARKVWFTLKPGLRFGDFYQDSKVVNEVAFEWLERHRAARFFLFLHYMDPHDPYFEHPYDGYGIARVGNEHPDPALADEMKRLYRGEIEYLDAQVGDLIEHLEALGIYDDSIIMLTADHGEEFYEHGGWWHGLTLYEEQIRLPLLVKWRRGRPEAPPRVTEPLARTIDVAPTLIARGGATPPSAMEGVDLLLPAGQRAEKDELVFAEEDHEGNVLRALRSSEWKLIEANEGNPRGLESVEFYDIRQDPTERENLMESGPGPALDVFADTLDTFHDRAQGQAVQAEDVEISPEECQRLKALGYVEDCAPEGT